MIYSSPTSLQSARERCLRFWYFRKALNLSEPTRHSQAYGHVAHAVLERYMLADEVGRGSGGEPLELYPEGWTVDPQTGEVLSEPEAAQVRRLVELAIERGVVYRPPIREPESKIDEAELVPGLKLVGYVDLMLPDGVWDYKTRKSKRYALSADRLLDDTQMLVYALHVDAERVKHGLPRVPIQLRHLNFIKGYRKRSGEEEPEDVYDREALATPEHLDAFKQKLEVLRDEMIEARQVPEARWSDVPGPRPGSDGCNAYGGCHFRNICLGYQSVPQFKIQQSLTEGQEVVSRAAALSVMKKLGKTPGQPASPPEEAEAKAPATPPPAKPLEEPPEVNPAREPAPWAKPGCVSCQGNPVAGFNSKGSPCRVCESWARSKGIAGAMEYELGVDEEGLPTWTARATPPVGDAEELELAGEPSAKAPTAPSVPPQPPAEPAPESASKPKATRKKAARAKAAVKVEGLTLFVGCAPAPGPNVPELLDYHRWVTELRAEYAADGKLPSYWDADAFARRDAMQAVLPEIVRDRLQGTWMVARGVSLGSPDDQAVLGTLRGLADLVIEA